MSAVVEEGNNVTLTCNASGIPSPSMTWRLVGSPVILSQNAAFTIVNVTRPGIPMEELLYQCTATNGIGNAANDTATITVHCKLQYLLIAQHMLSTLFRACDNLFLAFR